MPRDRVDLFSPLESGGRNEQWHVKLLFIEGVAVQDRAVVPELFPVIGHKNEDGVVESSG